MGVATGFRDLDAILDGGLQKGCLYVLAARPSMGKTSMALSMIDYICFKKNRTVTYFSLEDSKRQIIDRILSLRAEIEYYKIRTGDVEGEDWKRLAKVAESIGESKLIIDDTSCMDAQKISAKCIGHRQDYDDLALVVIDYLQLLSGFDNNESYERLFLKEIKRLRNLAIELNRPIVVLSQVSCVVEQRESHRPVLSDLITSDAVLQCVDAVIFIYRDEYYNDDSEREGLAELIVAKNNMGAVGTIEIEFDKCFAKFKNRQNLW